MPALSDLGKQMYSSARRGAVWLARMNDVKGHFVHGWVPALNLPLEGDHALRQAGAAFALARAARYFQEDRQTARATQAILALLADTTESADKKERHPVLPSAVHRVSAASLLILAINELPSPGKDLLDESEQLCEYLHCQQQSDGSLRVNEPAGGSAPEDGEWTSQYVGQALQALMSSQEHRPAGWKTELVRRALPLSMKWWREHKDRNFVCSHAAACTEAFLRTKEKVFAEAVFEMNDWLCGLQHDRLDERRPQWLGGFQNTIDGKLVSNAPDVSSALCTEALAEACRVTRQLGDVTRNDRYMAALERGLQFLSTLQYTEADTQHFADWYRPHLVGGFHAGHKDGTLRIDYTQHAVCALVQYLRYSEAR
jgi:hypothetical protein